jgi:acetolactate synthase-1/2/3 large subunit
MGFSIPAGMAASLVRPEQKTVSLVGDGGFLMRAGELETAARLGLSPVIVIFDDGTLGMIRVKQRAKGYAREGVDLRQTDFVRLAESFGGAGHEVHTLDQFDTAFKAALESDRLSVIDVRVDPEAYLAHVLPIRGL